MSNPLPPKKENVEPLHDGAGFVDLSGQSGNSTVLAELIDNGIKLTVRGYALGIGTVLAVTGDRLLVERRKLTGSEQHSWTVRQIADIRVARLLGDWGPNDSFKSPYRFEVHIDVHPGEGKRFRVRAVDEAEARWLATTLRQALRLPEPDPLGKPPPFLEREEQPAGSEIELLRSAQRVALTVPAPGFHHPSAQVWLQVGLVLFAIVVGLVALKFCFPKNIFLELAGDWCAWSLIGFLGLLSIVSIIEAVNRARRRAVLAVVGDTLVVRQENLLRTKEQLWERRRVADIRVGSTQEGKFDNDYIRTMSNNNVDPIWELHIRLKRGEIIRLLEDYGDADLQWLATVLRRALRVPADPLAEIRGTSCG